ncbi:hypothetical protein HNP73_002408 [Amaricoccus macauensis]|uniref:DUF1489 family protein n=1 Tax=Amaricoccus macauensis TaxID=57001 RepID=A0A840STF3_9RHOB|nr:DUF1489 domain-containing protein [Amaricoccus macauensis]MBB5222472.1 hypothetical protein [Amaricoccus macauensis]
MGVHLIKLCVGAEAVEDLLAWQADRIAERRAAGLDPHPYHVTRMWPKRADELTDGGSLYWVFRGLVLARQRVLGLEARQGADGIARCAIRLDPEVVRTVPQPRRPFQGWRYLRPEDAPADLAAGQAEADLPPTLAAGLAELGVL